MIIECLLGRKYALCWMKPKGTTLKLNTIKYWQVYENCDFKVRISETNRSQPLVEGGT